jgi:hypothetical protein
MSKLGKFASGRVVIANYDNGSLQHHQPVPKVFLRVIATGCQGTLPQCGKPRSVKDPFGEIDRAIALVKRFQAPNPMSRLLSISKVPCLPRPSLLRGLASIWSVLLIAYQLPRKVV